MKVVLSVELASYEDSSTETETEETYAELVKELDLDFAPFLGLELQLTCIMSNDPKSREYQDILAAAPELVTGIFKLEAVYYDVKGRKFHVIARDGYQTVEMLHSAIKQLVVGYDFVRS